MKRKDITKKIICLITLSGLTFAALFSAPAKNALASSYEAQSRLDELKKQSEENERAIQDAEAKKKAAEAAVDQAQSIAAQRQENADRYKSLYNDVRTNLDLTKLEVEDMKYELSQVNESLKQTEEEAKKQYEAMKKRIAYMYEHKLNKDFFTIMAESGSFAQALNEMDNVKAIAAYDRAQLQRYQNTMQEVAKKKEEVEQKHAELSQFQQVLNKSAGQLQTLYAAAGEELREARADVNAAANNARAVELQLKEFETKRAALSDRQAEAQALLAQAIAKEQAAREAAGKEREYTGGAVSATTDELTFLAATIQAEVGILPMEGKLAVGSVIMNRVKSSYFPDTITDVITSPDQFTTYTIGAIDYILENGGPNEDCMEAARRVVAGERTGDWLFFMTVKAAERLRIAHYELVCGCAFFYKWERLPEPEEPQEPQQPSVPETPAEPEQPSQPSEPETPQQPEQPKQPENPLAPVQPAEPSEPEIPAEPEQPSEPETPQEPQTSG